MNVRLVPGNLTFLGELGSIFSSLLLGVFQKRVSVSDSSRKSLSFLSFDEIFKASVRLADHALVRFADHALDLIKANKLLDGFRRIIQSIYRPHEIFLISVGVLEKYFWTKS